ncbi:MAG: hypothetical protein KC680_00205 [Candidatus Peregrinibacteria bacterium]|nr:hypothetical protein [Candidatus Peregrinibacteria bacterium]MCB9807950.1 hypothetical protein [Candidatus Peribacteria bacterium]
MESDYPHQEVLSHDALYALYVQFKEEELAFAVQQSSSEYSKKYYASQKPMDFPQFLDWITDMDLHQVLSHQELWKRGFASWNASEIRRMRTLMRRLQREEVSDAVVQQLRDRLNIFKRFDK